MKKIPTIFERDWQGDRSRVLPTVVIGCDWVFLGEGVPRRKYDGSACLLNGGRLYKRFAHRLAHDGTLEGEELLQAPLPDDWGAPEGFLLADVELDAKRPQEFLKLIGWLPVGEGSEDRWHREAFRATPHLPDGTYELVGPKVQGNPERFSEHTLVLHQNAEVIEDFPRDFAGISTYFAGADIEGIVFHHPDGRMAKIKARDFGYARRAALQRA